MTTRPRILVVDDSQLNRLLIRACMTQAGYEVIEADNGESALRTLHEIPVNLVLLDLVMPCMDGLECLDLLRADERTRHLPVVIVSAMDNREDIAYGLERGADAYLTLPLDFARLRQIAADYIPTPDPIVA